jgi:hypothetical protein
MVRSFAKSCFGRLQSYHHPFFTHKPETPAREKRSKVFLAALRACGKCIFGRWFLELLGRKSGDFRYDSEFRSDN